MTQDEIKKAAEDYIESLGGPTRSISWGDSRTGFIAGIKYALTHQWINVAERLPEEDETVLVRCDTNESGLEFTTAYLHREVWCMDDFYCDCDVIAWMPIPPCLCPPKNN